MKGPRFPGKKNKKYIYIYNFPKLGLQHEGEIFFTDLQILGCELHKNAFGGWATPDPLGEL